MNVEKVNEIKDRIAKCEIESAKAKGVIENIQAEWKKEFGTDDVEVIKGKLAKMEDDLKASDKRIEKLYNELLEAYDWENL